MGKTGKWIKNFLIGKKDHHHSKEPPQQPPSPAATPAATPKEKKRWSFRRSSAAAQKELSYSAGAEINNSKQEMIESEHALAVAAATAAAADAAAAAAKAAAAVMQLTAAAGGGRAASASEEAAATRIQSVFRGCLARKALNALRGLVKLQALVRGHLVRKQAAATLRCMQALITAQARARAQRIQMAEDQDKPNNNNNQRLSVHRKSTQDSYRFRHSFKDYERGTEENIKIVEMDLGESKGNTKTRNSNHLQTTPTHNNNNTLSETPRISSSPAASVTAEQSPRTFSGHFEDYSFNNTAQSSPHCPISKPETHRFISPIPTTRSEYSADSLYNEYPFYPSYMANTESSRAKVRSHSAPKQRPAEPFERQPSARRSRPSIEGRNVPRAVRMQRSSSHVASAAQNYQYPWSIKLDRSNISIKDSECGSTCSVLTTHTMYCRPVVGFDVQGNRY